MNPARAILVLFLGVLTVWPALAAERVLDAGVHHLRNAGGREWAEFPEQAGANELLVRFEAEPNPSEFTLRVRHRDLKQQWRVTLNGKELAKLPQDEREMITFWPVPAGSLKGGRNELRVVGPASPADDVMVGEITLLDLPKSRLLSEASIDVTVLDTEGKQPLPSRLTLTDARGIPIEFGNSSNNEHAVRPGVLYTATGSAALNVPAGRYRLHASRGFEYSLATREFDLKPGDRAPGRFALTREVDTAGYVAADTHVHTATYARHGDASIAERMITLAGEGVELPVSAEHNLLVDFESHAKSANVRRFFTPVLGQELTTPAAGHYNLFPRSPDFKTPNVRALTDWPKVSEAIRAGATNDAVVILNHARDVHGGFRPFDPNRHLSITGESIDGSTLPANAMEVVNSGAVLSDPMLLIHDWMGLLTRGLKVTPVGASDSHDVTRYVVGQGRTYVRADDADPAKIDIAKAVENFRAGKVLVSFGLLVEAGIDGRRPGEVHSPPAGATHVKAKLRVQGPSWSEARHVSLYVNGQKFREADVPDADASRPGVKFTADWEVPLPKHDLALVVLVTGPGITAPHWPTAKPYQPTGIEFVPYTLALTAPIYVDVDRSNSYESPRDYASRILAGDPGDGDLVRGFADHDAATAAHVASLLRAKDGSGFEERLLRLLPRIAPHAAAGVRTYLDQWRLAPRRTGDGDVPASRGN